MSIPISNFSHSIIWNQNVEADTVQFPWDDPLEGALTEVRLSLAKREEREPCEEIQQLKEFVSRIATYSEASFETKMRDLGFLIYFLEHELSSSIEEFYQELERGQFDIASIADQWFEKQIKKREGYQEDPIESYTSKETFLHFLIRLLLKKDGSLSTPGLYSAHACFDSFLIFLLPEEQHLQIKSLLTQFIENKKFQESFKASRHCHKEMEEIIGKTLKLSSVVKMDVYLTRFALLFCLFSQISQKLDQRNCYAIVAIKNLLFQFPTTLFSLLETLVATGTVPSEKGWVSCKVAFLLDMESQETTWLNPRQQQNIVEERETKKRKLMKEEELHFEVPHLQDILITAIEFNALNGMEESIKSAFLKQCCKTIYDSMTCFFLEKCDASLHPIVIQGLEDSKKAFLKNLDSILWLKNGKSPNGVNKKGILPLEKLLNAPCYLFELKPNGTLEIVRTLIEFRSIFSTAMMAGLQKLEEPLFKEYAKEFYASSGTLQLVAQILSEFSINETNIIIEPDVFFQANRALLLQSGGYPDCILKELFKIEMRKKSICAQTPLEFLSILVTSLAINQFPHPILLAENGEEEDSFIEPQDNTSSVNWEEAFKHAFTLLPYHRESWRNAYKRFMAEDFQADQKKRAFALISKEKKEFIYETLKQHYSEDVLHWIWSDSLKVGELKSNLDVLEKKESTNQSQANKLFNYFQNSMSLKFLLNYFPQILTNLGLSGSLYESCLFRISENLGISYIFSTKSLAFHIQHVLIQLKLKCEMSTIENVIEDIFQIPFTVEFADMNYQGQKLIIKYDFYEEKYCFYIRFENSEDSPLSKELTLKYLKLSLFFPI